MEAQCQAITQGGQRCRGKARPSGFCFSHDPALAQARQEGSARGGKNKTTEARAARLVPDTLRPVLFKVLQAMQDVSTGRMEPRVASALASLASVVVRIHEAERAEQPIEEERPPKVVVTWLSDAQAEQQARAATAQRALERISRLEGGARGNGAG
jgi:hypothetical protein